MRPAQHPRIAELVQQHRQKVLASLVGHFKDIELSEDCYQEASLKALLSWPQQGIPDAPERWLLKTAYHKGLDHHKHQNVVTKKQPDVRVWQNLEANHEIDFDALNIPDDRLKLIFMCCHPALNINAQIALTLQTVAGMSTQQVANVFLLKTPTMAQRLVRTKNKIKKSGIPFSIPKPAELSERLNAVLGVIYLIYDQGYFSITHTSTMDSGETTLALDLATALNQLLPNQAELLGLLALMHFHFARFPARQEGQITTLEHQNRSLWDHAHIKLADHYLQQAVDLKRLGPYQIQAAISGVHSQAASFADTDWQQITLLYHKLFEHQPSPVISLNLAVATAYAGDAKAALHRLISLESHPQMQTYLPLTLAKADVLMQLEENQSARQLLDEAKNRSPHPRQQAWIQNQIDLINS